jgi:hypothetical protein
MQKRPLTLISLLVIAVAVLFLLSAGCTGMESGNGISPPGDGTLPLTRPDASPPVTRPQAPDGAVPAVPSPVVTVSGELYEDMEEIQDTLYALSEEWDLTGLSCSGTACTGSFVSVNGDELVIEATIYQSVESAHAAFEADKEEGSGYRQIAVDAGDEAYAWQYRTTAQLGFRKSNLVVIMDYRVAGGLASMDDIRSIASVAAGSL